MNLDHSNPHLPTVDRVRLAAVSGGDAEFERDLLKDFAEDARRHAAAIAEAAGRGDVERVRREAHALKGSARNVGAPAVAATAGEIEAAASGGSIDAGACARLGGEIERLMAEVAT